MSTDKTLADVQPGGRVRLAGRSPNLTRSDDDRARFESWATAQGLDPTVRLMLTSHPPQDGGYADNSLQRLWQAWQAALSAQPSPATCEEDLQVQPSPGGQGALAEAARRVISDVDSGDYHGEISESTYAALEAALAARQPVGEPVPFAVESKAFETHAASRKLNLEQHPLHYLFLDPVTYEARQAWKAALVFAPHAQAVDLGPVRVLADHAAGRINHANNGLCPDEVEGHDTRDPDCPVCCALIDSQAVGE